MTTFNELLERRCQEVNSCLCAGLDTDLGKIPDWFQKGWPDFDILRFNCEVVDALHDLVLAFKLNASFYEQFGPAGKLALKRSVEYCKRVAPSVVTIIDYKRADIGNSNLGYIAEGFEYFGADAVTVNPYFGREAMQPYLDRKDKGIIILCRTSNPGAGWLQDKTLTEDGLPLYQVVARDVANEWNTNNNCAVVVGATVPDQLAAVRKLIGDMWILMPGIGKQGAEVQAAVEAAQTATGGGIILNASRSLQFVSAEINCFAAIRNEAIRLNQQINQYRNEE